MPGMDHARRLLLDELDSRSYILATTEGDTVVGTIRATSMEELPEADPLHDRFGTARFPVPAARQLMVGRLMVAREHRGGRSCSLLFAKAYEEALRRGFEVALLECDPRNVPLYESIGCRQSAAVYCDSQAGLTVPMALLIRPMASKSPRLSLLPSPNSRNERLWSPGRNTA